MKYQFKNQFYAITGLSFGLLATILGMNMSSAIESTPALVGMISAIWFSVSASIVGGGVNKD
jgi:DNA mismatch repair protein MutH